MRVKRNEDLILVDSEYEFLRILLGYVGLREELIKVPGKVGKVVMQFAWNHYGGDLSPIFGMGDAC